MACCPTSCPARPAWGRACTLAADHIAHFAAHMLEPGSRPVVSPWELRTSRPLGRCSAPPHRTQVHGNQGARMCQAIAARVQQTAVVNSPKIIPRNIGRRRR